MTNALLLLDFIFRMVTNSVVTILREIAYFCHPCAQVSICSGTTKRGDGSFVKPYSSLDVRRKPEEGPGRANVKPRIDDRPMHDVQVT